MTKKKKTAVVFTIKFSEMSVMEILALADNDNDLCDDKQKYYRFGKNLKLAYDVMVKAGHRSSLDDLFSNNDQFDAVPDEIVDLLMPYMAKHINRSDINDYITFNASDYKNGSCVDTFEQCAKALFECCVANAPNGVKIIP